MHDNAYWLISITSDTAQVSLVSNKIISLGQEIEWSSDNPDSLLKAIDTSISTQNNDETSNCAFIVPPNWVGPDGSISPQILTNLKSICQKLKFHPLGFVSYDDAFIESYDHDDSFPGSYLLVYFSPKHYHLSLVYLGQIKKRFTADFSADFSVSKFEEQLSALEFTSALPPKIIVIGSYSPEIIDDLKNYNWLARQDLETFLHLPNVISLDPSSLAQIFVDTVKKQITPAATSITNNIIDVIPVSDTTEEIDATSLGFTAEDSPVEVNPVLEEPPQNSNVGTHHDAFLHNFSFPKLKFNYIYLLPLVLLPFLPVLPLYFSRVDLTIYQNPTEFSEIFAFTPDPASNVTTKTFDLSVGTSSSTTGKKEVGEKAKGEVIVFNKLDRSITVNKGLVITDTSGKEFETTNNILLPASTSNLDTGIITMGQVKAAVTAKIIGPEYNLSENIAFTIKSDPNLLAKSTKAFTGGTRDQIAVVTQADKTKVLESAKELLKQQAKNDINSQKSTENSILDSTMVYENQKTTFNREVGEEADVLSLQLSSKVSFLYFDLLQKQNIISTFFPKRESLTLLDKNSAKVTLNYNSGQLTLTGVANPLINIDQLKLKLVGKKESDLKSILNTLPKYYQHDLNNSLWFFNLLHRLPVKSNLINIIIKN